MSEEVQVVYKLDNPYLARTTYKLKLNFEDKNNLQRLKLRDYLSKYFNVEKERIIIKKIVTNFGGLESYAYVNVYHKPELIKIEPRYILLRHLPREERKKILEEEKKKKLELKETKKEKK
jgi:ribosomal protein S24E